MGHEQSKPTKLTDNSGELFTYLDKSICYPGETINGTILIKLHSKPRSIQTIQINIIQNEYWSHQSTKKTKSTSVVLASQVINIMRILQPGEYKFNFNITIPLFAKCSFEYPLVNTCAYIRNNIQASSNEIPSALTNQIILIKKPATVLDSPLNLSITNNPKLVFIEQGPIIIKASYPSNNYSFFSLIPINVSIDWSRSKLPIKTCDVSLIRKIKYLNNGIEDKNLITEDVLWHVTKLLTDGKCNFNESILICDTEEMNNRYTYNSHNMTFPDKTQIIRFLPSIKTGFIDCEYFIKIVCTYDVFSKIPMVDKPTLIMPLSISHYSSIDLANSVNQIGQKLENQFNMGNNLMNPMMSQYQPNQNQMMMSQQVMMSQFQPNPMMSQYQPYPNQSMIPPQNIISKPNPNKIPMFQQQMNQYNPNSNSNIIGNSKNNNKENNSQAPNYIQPNQQMNNNGDDQNLENNYPSLEEVDPPPSNISNNQNTPKDTFNTKH